MAFPLSAGRMMVSESDLSSLMAAVCLLVRLLLIVSLFCGKIVGA